MALNKQSARLKKSKGYLHGYLDGMNDKFKGEIPQEIAKELLDFVSLIARHEGTEVTPELAALAGQLVAKAERK